MESQKELAQKVAKLQPWVNEIRAWADGKNPENVQSILLRFQEQVLEDAAAPDLLEALRALQQEIKTAVKFDVKKHYSLMVAEVAASKAIEKAEGK